MKKSNFVVAYKGRRKVEPKANSIWGDVDLKSIARETQQATAHMSKQTQREDASDVGISLPVPAIAESTLLTPSLGQLTTASATRERAMAVESDTVVHTDAPASDAGAAASVLKKQRKPRTKKVVAAVNTNPVVEPVVPSVMAPAKRGRPAKAKAEASVRAGTAKSKPAKKAPETAAPAAAIDEMADLLQLEEENKRLRKLLAEKLRAENAELRKRLNLA